MKKIIPINKNEEYKVEITGLGYEGEGVCKINDFTVFVKGALLGEIVDIKIVKVNKNFGFGRLVNVVEPSKDRVEPVCSIYNRCGGCGLQHFSYKAQLEFKKQRIYDCITRIGKIKISEDGENGAILHDTIGMDNPYRYRNKVQLPVREYNGEVKIGFYSPRSHDIVDMEKCYIQHEEADKVVSIFRHWMKEFNIRAYNEQKGTGNIRHIMVRKAFKTGQIMVVVVTNQKKLTYKDELIDRLVKEIDGITSIVQNINSKKTNVILGLKCITLWGKDVITDYIKDFKFSISPLSFFQVNPVQTEKLYAKALEYADLKGEETVFDAYCGAGTISLFLSQKAKKVYGVEIIPEAIENAKQNAIENNVNNAEFIVGKSEEVIPRLIEKGIMADVVVVDPPRKGCEKSLLESIVTMSPKKIVYVSCDPGTLARDLEVLSDSGYEVKEIQGVDMFPATGHVETVVLLSQQNQVIG